MTFLHLLHLVVGYNLHVERMRCKTSSAKKWWLHFFFDIMILCYIILCKSIWCLCYFEMYFLSFKLFCVWRNCGTQTPEFNMICFSFYKHMFKETFCLWNVIDRVLIHLLSYITNLVCWSLSAHTAFPWPIFLYLRWSAMIHVQPGVLFSH